MKSNALNTYGSLVVLSVAVTAAACSEEYDGGSQVVGAGGVAGGGASPSSGVGPGGAGDSGNTNQSSSIGGYGGGGGGDLAGTAGLTQATNPGGATAGAAGSAGVAGGGSAELSGVETPGANCTVPEMPDFSALKEIPKLPDPFTMMDGTAVTSKEQWICRHREIAAMVQHYETGPKEIKKATVRGTATGNGLKIDVSGGVQDVSFTVDIALPATGTPPYPALIGLKSLFGGAAGSLNNSRLQQLGIAIITYDHNGVQPEGDRTSGIFSKFHGGTSGALIAWAWGVSRLIDALETTPEAKIDPKRLAVTGCSRDGKGALMIGAMDSRIALTIPQESGSGGVAAWRVSEVDNAGRTGSEGVQNLSRTYSETQWFSSVTATMPETTAVPKHAPCRSARSGCRPER